MVGVLVIARASSRAFFIRNISRVLRLSNFRFMLTAVVINRHMLYSVLMAKGRTKSAVILQTLQEGALTFADLLINMSLTPLRHPYKGFPALLSRKDVSIKRLFNNMADLSQEKRKFRDVLYNLRRDGLVTSSKADENTMWQLSQKGTKELKKLANEPQRRYIKESSAEVTVISYDIPERNRRDRDWLRSILRLLDFKILHQSVWLGKNKIPSILLGDLRERNIHKFIHIFTIGKQGSLKQIL